MFQIKTSNDEKAFRFESTCKASVDVTIREMVWMSNTRIRIVALAEALEQLSQHGISKPLDQFGLGKDLEADKSSDSYHPDPLGHRTGNGPGPTLASTLNRVSTDALEYVRNPLEKMSRQVLEGKINLMRGAVMMAYPMGLPSYDAIAGLLEEETVVEILAGSQAGQALLDPKTAQLWWAGKEFFRDDCLAARVGTNEKTKIVARLTKQGAGAPVREPAVSEDERKAMMAHYFKKQEEIKKCNEADEEEYLHSSWANPAEMKNQMRGTLNIRPF